MHTVFYVHHSDPAHGFGALIVNGWSMFLIGALLADKVILNQIVAPVKFDLVKGKMR